MNSKTLSSTPIVPGNASGKLLVASEPLSFWGGYDYHTGTVIDQRHPLANQVAAGRILALPFTRGSSSTTSVLLEAVKAGTAPAAIVTTESDTFFTLASVVADEMYGTPIPLYVVTENDFSFLQNGKSVNINSSGNITSMQRPC